MEVEGTVTRQLGDQARLIRKLSDRNDELKKHNDQMLWMLEESYHYACHMHDAHDETEYLRDLAERYERRDELD